jgi:hypothetical protein
MRGKSRAPLQEREGHQPVAATSVAVHPPEAVGQDLALEVAAEFTLHEAGQRVIRGPQSLSVAEGSPAVQIRSIGREERHAHSDSLGDGPDRG